MRLLCFGSSVRWQRRKTQNSARGTGNLTRDIGIGTNIYFMPQKIASYQNGTALSTCHINRDIIQIFTTRLGYDSDVYQSSESNI